MLRMVCIGHVIEYGEYFLFKKIFGEYFFFIRNWYPTAPYCMHVSKDTGSSSYERKIFRPSVIFFFLDISNISASEQEVWRGFYLTGLSVDAFQ
jgi:hypothetical protein